MWITYIDDISLPARFQMHFLLKPFALFYELKDYQLAEDGGKAKVFFALLGLHLKSKFYSGKVVSEWIAGFKVEAYDYPTLINLYKEIFLAKVYDFQAENEAPLIIDCGANIGMTALFLKRRFPKSRILAFEPNPNSFRLLKLNMENNAIDGVTLFNCALSSVEGEGNFNVPIKKGSLNGSLLMNNFPSAPVRVKLCRLSDFIQKETVDLLKLDVEGAEELVLRDLNSKGCLEKVKNIVVEYHQFDGGLSLSGFVSSIEASGFTSNVRSVDDLKSLNQNIIFSFHRRG